MWCEIALIKQPTTKTAKSTPIIKEIGSESEAMTSVALVFISATKFVGSVNIDNIKKLLFLNASFKRAVAEITAR